MDKRGNEIGSTSLMGSTKGQEEVGTEDRLRESLKIEKGGEVLPSTKERKNHTKNKHSKSKRHYRSTLSSSSTEKSSPSTKRLKFRRKKRKHRKRSSSLSYSPLPSSSSESSEARNIEGTLGNRFQVIFEKDKFRYSLPTDMAEYANTHFETYVKEADLKQHILMENPIPDNLDQIKKLDDFVRDILKDEHIQKDLDMEITIEKIQSKNACIMDPLSKLWILVKEARRSNEKQIPFNLDNIRAYIEKTVLLFGQTSNYSIFFRRYNILATLNDPTQQSREMFRKEAYLLQQHDRNLLGKKFSE